METSLKFAGLVLLFTLTATASGADVQENWTKHCASCHGKDGKGQTKAGKMAEVKDFTDVTYQGSFTDEHGIKQVKEGLKDKNGKDRMKPYADKLTEPEIKELLGKIRAMKK